MDFANRGARPAGTEGISPSVQNSGSQKKSKMSSSKWLRIMTIVLLFAGTLIGVALIALMIFGKQTDETSYVKKKQYQAIFLNGGQVYFGKIGKFTDTYITLSDIYYLRVNQQVQPGQTTASNDVSLAKLGNELHGPNDEMIINRSEVQFWENLKDDGQVVKAITTYKANPNAANQQQSTTDTNTTNNNTTNNTNTSTNKKQ